jgi:CRP/FNR family nitrogen fixation transcriptional regulator
MAFEPISEHLAPAATVGRLIELTLGLSLPGSVLTLSPDEEVFAEEEEAAFVYKVVSGAVRTTRLLSDGRRQIGAFYLPGDVFGLESGPVHRFSAEAIKPTKVAMVRRSGVERAAAQDPVAARQLWLLAAHELEDLQDHMVLLGRKTAVERVASFLVKLSQRADTRVIDLPMSRNDIGDHLGLTLETVSRAMSQLVRDRAISLPNARHVVLNNLSALTC